MSEIVNNLNMLSIEFSNLARAIQQLGSSTDSAVASASCSMVQECYNIQNQLHHLQNCVDWGKIERMAEIFDDPASVVKWRQGNLTTSEET